MVLYLETAPPIKPLAWTKSISFIPDKCTNFYISLIPRHSSFKPFLSKNEPSFNETACIRHLNPDLSGKTTNRISPSHFFYCYI
jgi:hypothetical protein